MIDPLPVTPQQAAQVLASLHVTPVMIRYTNTTAALGVAWDVTGLVWLWIVLQFGIARRIAVWSQGAGRKLFLAGALFWIAYEAVSGIVFLPLSLYGTFHLPHEYGLSNQTLRAWLHDKLVTWLVDAAIGAALTGTLLWTIRRLPASWPYWFAALLVPLIAFGIFAAPLVIDPLYNKFTPLPATSPLRPGIERLAARAGIPHAEIFVVDKSKQTKATNAYVTGLGSTARIVIWDTIIEKTSPAELDAVLSHEMGHYVEHHVTIGFWLTSASLFVILPFVRWFCLLLIRRYGVRWGVATLHEPAAIPVILLAVSLVTLVTSPISEGASRYIEHRADAFGLALCGDRVATADAFIALTRDNLSNPYPPAWIQVLSSHPPLGERIRFALYGAPSELWPIPPQIPRER